MGIHTIDVLATLTLHVEAGSEDEARAKVYAVESQNPLVSIGDGVEVHELTLGRHIGSSFEYVHGPMEDEDEGCPGHESLSGAAMGESTYCDGSCVKELTVH